MLHTISSIAACTMLLFSFSQAGYADSRQDLETIGKAIGFIKNGPKGNITMDIVYDPSSSVSKEHADTISELLSSGISSSRVKLTGNKVSSIDRASSKVIFVTRDTGSMHESVLSKAVQSNAITVSTDESCLGNGCVMVVNTKPGVNIVVSMDAANKTQTVFYSAFRMVITEK